MHAPPNELDGARVICFTTLDERHSATGATRHFRDGAVQTTFAGLVIAQYPGDFGVYLFYCDDNWRVQNDTLHDSVEAAKTQADSEFRGTANTWTSKGVEPDRAGNSRRSGH